MKKVLVSFFVLLAAGLVFNRANASELNGTSVSTAQTDSLRAMMDQLYVNYFAIFHGSPVGTPSSPYTLDRNGKNTASSFNTMNFDSELTTAYMFNSDIGFGPDIPFLLVPVQGQGLVMGDVGVKAFNRRLISGGGFNLYENLILQAPTSKASRNRGMDFAIKTTPAVRYQVPHSRFVLGAWTEQKAYLGVDSGKTLKLYAAPYVGYQLSRSFALNLEYEMETDHNKGSGSWDLTNYQTDLMPGFVWSVTPNLLVNPYLQVFTGNRVTADTTAFGAVISATVL